MSYKNINTSNTDKEIAKRLSDLTKDNSIDSAEIIGEDQKFDLDKEKEKIKNSRNKGNETLKREEKKPFIQDLGNIFADNFSFAWSSFKSAFLSVTLGGKTLFAQKILILIFIAIPAIFGGIAVFMTGVILILLWILYLMLKKSSNFLQKLEDKFKSKLIPWRNFIRSNKNQSLPEKIIQFGIYTLAIGANGAMYMMVKGVKIPIKSLSEITKYVGNIADKIGETLNVIAKTPAKIHNEALQKREPELGRSHSMKAQKVALGAERKRNLFEQQQKRARTRTREKSPTVKEAGKIKEMTKIKEQTAMKDAEKSKFEQEKIINEKIKEAEIIKQQGLEKSKIAEIDAERANELSKSQETISKGLEKDGQAREPKLEKGGDFDPIGQIIGNLNAVSNEPSLIKEVGDIAGNIAGGIVEVTGETITEASKVLPKGVIQEVVKGAGQFIDKTGERIQGRNNTTTHVNSIGQGGGRGQGGGKSI